ncbi:antiviral reverse transcriptase Drt2 [Cucumibacter marinus]|uniref:antiviral reverse transcriptase Drt2 n=1 Tax=Cucumibacter marinus TaxID=1121252 RepID=UPI00040A55FF|nr:antiviral reverse transcriptase Drt2 [Cucumibacter marinus]
MPGSDLLDDLDSFDPETDEFVHHALTKSRSYKHFDDPLSGDDLVLDLSSHDPTHRFLPLLGFTDFRRRVVRKSNGSLEVKTKPRLIRFASHGDASYLQAYSSYLSEKYEAALREFGLSERVLAYRPTGKTNIHHAKSLFDEIRSNESCAVIAVDISGFFDSINHTILKNSLKFILKTNRLQGHDWTVFRNITKYSWVESEDLDFILGANRSRFGRVCSQSDFKTHVRGVKNGLVRVHDQPFGIPQGTPVSGLYANIYMIEFDRIMEDLTSRAGGSYRRYSDDIALVLPSKIDTKEWIGLTEKIIADFELCLSPDKSEVSHFSDLGQSCDHAIQYLGFTFDGASTLIRPSSIARYRNKMARGIHAKMVAAKLNNVPPSRVFQREARSKYTHLGLRRNFLTYAYRASRILGAPEIRQQVKHHVRWFNRAWQREQRRVFR